MFNEKVEDWKELLTDEAQQALAELFHDAKRHKGAYIQADDVKVAQVWAALIEMKAEMNAIKSMLEKLTAPFTSVVDVGDAEKRKAIERVAREIIKPTEAEHEEAAKKLVDSLMKF